MPILHIEVIGELQVPRNTLATKIADAAGVALASRPQGTWVVMARIDPTLRLTPATMRELRDR